jgi:hypothetical protein
MALGLLGPNGLQRALLVTLSLLLPRDEGRRHPREKSKEVDKGDGEAAFRTWIGRP